MRPLISTSPSFGTINARTPLVFAGQRIGIMGGSFNPPHAGHASVATLALRRLGLDQVWWVVTPGNPLKAQGGLPSVEVRMAAVRQLATAPRMRVTGFEAALGSHYTVDALTFLRQRHPGVRFVWLMGADGLVNFHHWRQWRRIAGLMAIAVVDRPGYRLKAVASRSARALARFCIPEHQAALLARTQPPRWTFLTARLSPLSSTELRVNSMRKTRRS